MDGLNLPSGTIVTRGEGQQIKTEQGTIDVDPAWRFLLILQQN